MLDTLGVSVPIFLEYEIIKDWDFKYTEPFWKAKKYRLKNGASIFFKYNTFTHILHFQFSASKIQHGTNARSYDFSNSVVVESEIEKAIETILGGIYLETCFLNICRVDLNKDFVFENEKDANAFMDFAKKILPARCENHEDYDTGFTSLSKSGGFRVYRKDLDKHLKRKDRAKMKPTVRIEFQMNRKFATKFYGKRFNLHEILTNELAAKMVWNKQLRKYGLDKKIVNRKTLDTVAKKYLTESEQKTLAQMNDIQAFDDKKSRRKQLKVIRKMTELLGICPYSCELDVDLSVSTIKEIINFRKTRELKKWETTLQQKTKSQTQSIRRITKFIDDSS